MQHETLGHRGCRGDPLHGIRRIARTVARLITSPQAGIPAGLEEAHSLGQTVKQHHADILAFFDHPGTSNGPTEAINGLLAHLRDTAQGIHNLTNYIAKSLLDEGGCRPYTHSLLWKAPFTLLNKESNTIDPRPRRRRNRNSGPGKNGVPDPAVPELD